MLRRARKSKRRQQQSKGVCPQSCWPARLLSCTARSRPRRTPSDSLMAPALIQGRAPVRPRRCPQSAVAVLAESVARENQSRVCPSLPAPAVWKAKHSISRSQKDKNCRRPDCIPKAPCHLRGLSAARRRGSAAAARSARHNEDSRCESDSRFHRIPFAASQVPHRASPVFLFARRKD